MSSQLGSTCLDSVLLGIFMRQVLQGVEDITCHLAALPEQPGQNQCRLSVSWGLSQGCLQVVVRSAG